MVKYKVGRGFLIAAFVFVCLGLFGCIISSLIVSGTTGIIKDLLIDAGGDTNISGGIVNYLVNNIEALDEADVGSYETLDAYTLKIVYACMLLMKKVMIIALIVCIVGFVLLLIALFKSKYVSSRKDLKLSMILSFVSILFVGLLPLVTGIMFALVSDDDFKIVN